MKVEGADTVIPFSGGYDDISIFDYISSSVSRFWDLKHPTAYGLPYSGFNSGTVWYSRITIASRGDSRILTPIKAGTVLESSDGINWSTLTSITWDFRGSMFRYFKYIGE